jgi:hypothetical protein
MIIDGALQFTGALGAINPDTPTTGTQQSTNVIDLGAPRDIAIGEPLDLFIEVMTTFTGGTSLQVDLQGAPDNGSGLPANVSVPRTRLPTPVGPSAAQALPRFLRLQYVTSGTHGAGGIYAGILLQRHDYVTYPAAITVPN